MIFQVLLSFDSNDLLFFPLKGALFHIVTIFLMVKDETAEIVITEL